ncbi:MAG TPA: rhodanese-like domain-containing protein [Aeromicrobium sp.]|nr:rhodanese-like domain-containing protein [Aeromicrobium sp.]
MTIDHLLADARSTYQRVTPVEAHRQTSDGAVIVDIRPAWQRTEEIPGSLVIERNHLEWRLDPASSARVEQATVGQRWIILCQEGYASSLAAASVRRLGLDVTDIIGGIDAWREAGLDLVIGPTDVERFVPAESEGGTS